MASLDSCTAFAISTKALTFFGSCLAMYQCTPGTAFLHGLLRCLSTLLPMWSFHQLRLAKTNHPGERGSLYRHCDQCSPGTPTIDEASAPEIIGKQLRTAQPNTHAATCRLSQDQILGSRSVKAIVRPRYPASAAGLGALTCLVNNMCSCRAVSSHKSSSASINGLKGASW